VTLDAQLTDLALTALLRVDRESSEWQELWSESESCEEADEMVAGLRAVLT
jgi:Domain of unknown function (DUF4259)